MTDLRAQLSRLVGQVIPEVSLGINSLNLRFANAATLSIWSPWTTNRPIERLPGCRLATARLDDHTLYLDTHEGFELRVDLRIHARHVPEALMFRRDDLMLVYP